MKKINLLFSLLITSLSVSSVNSAQAQRVYAVTANDQLTSFTASAPQITSLPITITGIVAGQTIVGIDSRPSTGELYLLGYNPQSLTANLYTLNKTTAEATKIGTTELQLPLGDGTKVGFDFNPAVDLIRVVSGSNKNYRLNPVTAAITSTDADLIFVSNDVNETVNPNIAASAYTNSYIGAGTTTLFNYDDSLNIITRQDPPNSGALNTVGSTGIIAGNTNAGFDIYTNPSTLVQTAYLSSSTNLYNINLSTGLATLIGQVGIGLTTIKDIAVEIDRTIPARKGKLIYALQGNANLISFDSENPGTIINLVTITGVAIGQNIVSMDARPKTKELYILGYNPNDGQSQLYTVIPETGVATAVGAYVKLELGTSPIGMDFNPTVDRVRVVGANNNNYRLNPITGGIAFTDTSLAYSATDANNGKNPFVSSVAYTNNFDGSTTTDLYGYDDSLNVIVLQSPPNRGTLTTIIPSGLKVNTADASTDIDIYYDNAAAKNTAFLVTNVGTETKDSLYILDLTSGGALLTRKGIIGLGVSVKDIAVEIDPLTTDISDNTAIGSSFQSKVYPNPLTSEANVTFETKAAADVQVYVIDLFGNTVIDSGIVHQSAGQHTYKIHTADLANGIYAVKIKINGTESTVIKVIK